jgi:hypothetical protein
MASQIIYRIYGSHYVVSHCWPTLTEEVFSETVRPWRFISWRLTNGLPNLVLWKKVCPTRTGLAFRIANVANWSRRSVMVGPPWCFQSVPQWCSACHCDWQPNSPTAQTMYVVFPALDNPTRPLRKRCMWYFRRLPFAFRWKEQVLASPSLLCFFLAFSTTRDIWNLSKVLISKFEISSYRTSTTIFIFITSPTVRKFSPQN